MIFKNITALVKVELKATRARMNVPLKRFRYGDLTFTLIFAALMFASGIGYGVGIQAASDLPVPNVLAGLAFTVFLFALVVLASYELQKSMWLGYEIPGYWMPLRSVEHVASSIISNFISIPLVLVTFFLGAVVSITFLQSVESTYLLLSGAILMLIIYMLLAGFLAVALKPLLLRVLGLLQKRGGGSRVPLKFLLIVIIFLGYILLFRGFGPTTGALQASIITVQAAWYLPLSWPSGFFVALLEGEASLAISFLFSSTFLVALVAYLSIRSFTWSMSYVPPSQVISRGEYAPKPAGLLRLGQPSSVVALMRKDLKAFTRRTELISAAMVPLMIFLATMIPATRAPTEMDRLVYGGIVIAIVALEAISLGLLMVGEEGQAIWRVYASPIDAGNLVRAKVLFITLASTIALLIGFFAYLLLAQLSTTAEAAGLILLAGVVLLITMPHSSLYTGFKAASFVELPRPRIVRTLPAIAWSLVNGILALLVLTPMGMYAAARLFLEFPFNPLMITIASLSSFIVAGGFAYAFYRLNLKAANRLLVECPT